jgi:hypothetical protein
MLRLFTTKPREMKDLYNDASNGLERLQDPYNKTADTLEEGLWYYDPCCGKYPKSIADLKDYLSSADTETCFDFAIMLRGPSPNFFLSLVLSVLSVRNEIFTSTQATDILKTRDENPDDEAINIDARISVQLLKFGAIPYGGGDWRLERLGGEGY